MEIVEADNSHLGIIKEIAEKTWPVCYKEIISQEQIHFMLDKMYSIAALKAQFKNGHKFILIASENENIGFASYELNFGKNQKAKLHKLYVLSGMVKKNYGKTLLNSVILTAIHTGQKSLILNVNRNNQAVGFYLKQGFVIVKEEDIDIGNGYFMNDYVMELGLQSP